MALPPLLHVDSGRVTKSPVTVNSPRPAYKFPGKPTAALPQAPALRQPEDPKSPTERHPWGVAGHPGTSHRYRYRSPKLPERVPIEEAEESKIQTTPSGGGPLGGLHRTR